MRIAVFLLTLFASAFASAQTPANLVRTLRWQNNSNRVITPSGNTFDRWAFEGCGYPTDALTLPIYTERIPLSGPSEVTAVITDVQSEPFNKPLHKDDDKLAPDFQVFVRTMQEGNRHYADVEFWPLRKTATGFERALSFSIKLSIQPSQKTNGSSERGGPFVSTSILSNGSAYKFGVSGTGIYKLDYNYLKNELGIKNLDDLDPRTIRLYGNGGTMLPEANIATRIDDLAENAIQVVGEEDGKFNNGDYILFYATGPEPWIYRASITDPELTVRKHLYDKYAWYFIKTGEAGNGLRVNQNEKLSVETTNQTTEFDDVKRLEDDRVNLLDFFVSAQGSGKQWFGDYFFQTRERTYSFEFPNLVAGSTARMRVEFAGRSSVTTFFRASAAGSTFSQTISSTNVTDVEASYAYEAAVVGNIKPSNDKFDVLITYLDASQQSEGWLDYIEINARRRLVMTGNSMEFRDLKTLTQDAVRFRLSGVNNSGIVIWDITDRQKVGTQLFQQSGDVVEFGTTTKNTLRNFIAFYANANFPKPDKKIGLIPTQNVHSTDNVHLAIVYHPTFEAQAKELAAHRKSFSGLDVATVSVEDIYNEFSSGAKDPTAIRDFARMLYERQPNKFEYLLLFGDGSFDPKNNTQSEANLDFVPVYETFQSFDPITAYPSDDFFALLSPEEGSNIVSGMLEIAVGRIPARNTAEAQAVVDKIKDYDTNPKVLGDWILRQTYLADDEDSNFHINQADQLAKEAKAAATYFNIEKIFFDAYQQVATSGGARFPDAETAINADIFKGTLIVQYIGHGGPRGWAQERVVDNSDIAGWDNRYKYPLIITATCSFGGYDDYATLTGGEQALLKSQSGAIALFTTVRAVYISGNNILTSAVQDKIFAKTNDRYRTMGEVLRDGKNTLVHAGDLDNARRFTLLGDPSMHLAFPEYRIATTRINDRPVNQNSIPDTLRALMPVKLDGIVTDINGAQLTSFNGKVSVSVYDKEQKLQTLVQDPGSAPYKFSIQRNLLFRGSASVKNGEFTINFVIPKDINYNFGKGKISYYAENGTPIDAAGADTSIVIGGNSGLVKDDLPPTIQVFMNTDAFVTGGITDANPKILVKCQDDYGMNVTGTSIGHDLTAVLDDNVQELLVLNDFYESEKDNFKKGHALYPLRNLKPGRHRLYIKGWDIANNPGEASTEFIVAEDGKAALAHVLNYPNPFTTNTYFQFEHNMAAQQLDVQVSIFSVAGRLVKTIQHRETLTDGYRVTDIQWDGRDDYGDQLAKGVYIYKVKVRGVNTGGQALTAESGFEKIVILK